jgi:hypothetical protein
LIAASVHADSNSDRLALQNTGMAIRAGFAKGDVEEIMRYHHPDVRKALSYDKILIGRDAVAADLRNSLSQVHLDFVSNEVESLFIAKDTAVEQTLFTIKVTPLAGGEPSLFKGRTMVVYVRYSRARLVGHRSERSFNLHLKWVGAAIHLAGRQSLRRELMLDVMRG